MRRACRFVWRWLMLPLFLATVASGVTWWATSPRPRVVIRSDGGGGLGSLSVDGMLLSMGENFVDADLSFYETNTGQQLSTVQRAHEASYWAKDGAYYLWPRETREEDGRLTVRRFQPRTGESQVLLQ